MQARIVVLKNGLQELCVPIEGSGAGIGRDPGNEVQLSLPEVSKRHAFIKATDSGWFVKDLNSRNGLYRNGTKVDQAFLKDGDKLVVGPYVLIFQIKEAGEPYKPVVNIDLSTLAAQQTIQARNGGR